jgi:asparagine N-glycosylation enzyme membrane subunit Stt3
MFINGYREGRTRPLTFSLLAIALSLGALGVWLKLSYGIVWAPVACGVVVGVAAYFMSAAWQNIYRRELRDMP